MGAGEVGIEREGSRGRDDEGGESREVISKAGREREGRQNTYR